MTDTPERRWHDMGGQDAGPVPMDGHDFALWEKRIDALMVLCGGKGLFTVDGLRRALEDMGYEAIDNLPLSLLPRLLDDGGPDKPLALGIDVRNRDFSTNALILLHSCPQKGKLTSLKRKRENWALTTLRSFSFEGKSWNGRALLTSETSIPSKSRIWS